MSEDNLPKYVLEVVGFDGASVKSYAGRSSVRKLVLDTANFQITESTGPGPASLTISLRTDGTIATQIADLAARIAALEALIYVEDNKTKIANPQGDVLVVAGQSMGQPALRFFEDAALGTKPSVVAMTVTALDVANQLATIGAMTLT